MSDTTHLQLAAGAPGPQTHQSKVRSGYTAAIGANANIMQRHNVLHPVIAASRVIPEIIFDEEEAWIVCTLRPGTQRDQQGKVIVGPLACSGVGMIRLSTLTTVVPAIGEYDDIDAQAAANLNLDPNASELQLEKAKLEAAQQKVLFGEGVGFINQAGQVTWSTLTLAEAMAFIQQHRSMVRESLNVINARAAMDTPPDDDIDAGAFGAVD